MLLQSQYQFLSNQLLVHTIYFCYIFSVTRKRSRFGHLTKDVRPEPAEGLFSYSPDFPRCTFSFANGRQCGLSRGEPLPEPRSSEWNFVVSILNSDDDEISLCSRLMTKGWRLKASHDELSPFPENR
jgi:hypothetical protein